MVREFPKHANLIKHPAQRHAAHSSQCQGHKQRDLHIIQTLKGQHPGQLTAAHANGLEHAEFLLAGKKIGNQRVGKIDQGKHKDKDQNTVKPGQFPTHADFKLSRQIIKTGDSHPFIRHSAKYCPPQLFTVLFCVKIYTACKIRYFRLKDGQFFLRQNKEMSCVADWNILDNPHHGISFPLSVVTGDGDGIPDLIVCPVNFFERAA